MIRGCEVGDKGDGIRRVPVHGPLIPIRTGVSGGFNKFDPLGSEQIRWSEVGRMFLILNSFISQGQKVEIMRVLCTNKILPLCTAQTY